MRIDSPKSKRDRTPFIGRRQERDHLHAALDGGAGLISLTGPSGIGKTRLARQVAAERFDVYDGEGGAWFCSLAGCRNAVDLELAVARTLGMQEQQGDELARSVANRGPLLLILDNADPIADQLGKILERWLERCVELQIVLTSLVPAGLPGEILLELRPLEAVDAVALYLDRAHRAWADRTFSFDEAGEVQELVKRLDQLPLAIELAAARVRILPPRAMLSMFEKRFELLRTIPAQATRGTAGPHESRRGSLFGALELTWSHLEPVERLALMRGAVFEGGFTAEAAGAVLFEEAGPSPEPGADEAAPETLALLDALHRRSLLLQEDLSPPRYFLMESVKEFALRELRASGGWEDAIWRHASFYLSKCRREPAWIRMQEPAALIRWLKRERENLIAIHHRFLSSAPPFAARAGIALSPLILLEGRTSSDVTLREALAAARRSQERELIFDALEASYIADFRHGRFAEAKAAMEEVVELARASDERALEAHTLSRLATLSLERKDIASSAAPLQLAIEVSKELDLPQLEGAILLVRGSHAIERGDLDAAEAHLIRSVELLRKHGQPGSELNSLYNLGLTLANQRKHARAQQVMWEAIQACRGIRYQGFEAHILQNLARLDLAAGLLDQAEAAGQESVAIQRELGNHYREGISLTTLGVISLERGELDEAAEHLSCAEELLRESDTSDVHPSVQIFLSVLEAKQQNLSEARRLLDLAYRTRRDVSGPSESIREFNLHFEGAEGILEVAEARQVEERPDAKALLESARSRLAILEGARVSWPSLIPVLLRLLREELTAWDAGAPPRQPPARRPLLKVGPELDWFQLPGGRQIPLHTRWVIRRIFAKLVRTRLESPGVVLDPHELIRAGWPDVPQTPDASPNRLHYAVWTLRDLGLRAVVQKTPSGYRLDPTVPVLQMGDDTSPAAAATD